MSEPQRSRSRFRAEVHDQERGRSEVRQGPRAYVEKRAKSVEGQIRGQDPVKALALAALYIADELFRAREELSKFEGDLPKRIGAMVDLLEVIVPAKGQR